ncbi:MAG: ribonuclease PH [Bdellovibrionaceae bacterium]|nr:ribonuclease PH [Pseudobdellovibrionaceae bacterium]
MRNDGRKNHQLREIKLTPHVSEYAEGSCLVEFGKTRVLCTASYEAKPPSWLSGTGKGWVTAEYGMLPRSTHTRMKRDKTASGGRTQEISRLIGRSLRAGVDLRALGEKQITVDCDVINADGGTRTAAITGGFVALALACEKLMAVSEVRSNPLTSYVAAVSVGLHGADLLLDLNYEEDSSIGTDMNVVMTNENKFIEIQGTAEDKPFSHEQLNALMFLAQSGTQELFKHQSAIVGHLIKSQI